jgi:hypothetical protein
MLLGFLTEAKKSFAHLCDNSSIHIIIENVFLGNNFYMFADQGNLKVLYDVGSKQYESR